MKRTKTLSAIAILVAFSSLVSAIEVSEQARRIAKETIILDSHIDVPYRVHKKWVDVTKATNGGDFDYPRAMAGGLNAPFMSIYIPATYEAPGKDY